MTPDGPPLPHASLLEQQAFLRRLARSLVADAHRAEDLAQDATLAALESAPANATSLRGWLARVVRNRAINLGVAEERRRARERTAARPAPSRSPDELEAHFQVQRRVMEAVDRLDEPYRTAILLRYYHDLGPAAIAVQLGVPVATVKSRLARALARLREQLDERETRGSHAWVAVLARGLGELHRPAAAAALAAGGVAMGVKLALSAAAACGALVLGGWWVLRPAEPVPNDTTVAAESSVTSPTPLAASEPSALHEPQIESAREALPLAESTPSAQTTPPAWPLTLELHGFDEHDDGPVFIEIHPNGALTPTKTEAHELAASLTLDLDVFFDVEMRPEQIVLLIDHPAYLPVQTNVRVPKELRDLAVHSGQLAAVVDLVRAKAIITGKVEKAPGFPNVDPRVAIFAMEGSKPAKQPIENVRLGADGRFRLRADGAEEHAIVAHDQQTTDFRPALSTESNEPALRPQTRILTVDVGQVLDVGSLPLGVGESLEGHVIPGGETTLLPGRVRAQLEATAPRSWQNLDWLDDRFELHGQLVDVAADGGFKITGLAARGYALNALSKRQSAGSPIWYRDRSTPRVVVSASATGVELHVDRVMVTIEVRAEGAPVPNAGLFYEVSGSDSSAGTSTDSDGKRSFELDLGLGIKLEASDPRYGSKKLELSAEDLLVSDRYVIEFEGPPEEPAQLVVVPHVKDPAQLESLFLDLFLYETSTTPPDRLEKERARPGKDVSGGAEIASVSTSGKLAETTREGDARVLSDLRPGRYLLCVSPRTSKPELDCFFLGEALEIDLPAGERVVHDWYPESGGTVRLEFTASGSARSGVILDAQSRQVDVRFHTPVPGSPGSSITRGILEVNSGIAEVRPALPSGAYILRLRMADKTYRSIPFQVAAGQVTNLKIDLSTL